jgi:hypothetical protein
MNPEALFIEATKAQDLRAHVGGLLTPELRALFAWCEAEEIVNDVWSECLFEVGDRFVKGQIS